MSYVIPPETAFPQSMPDPKFHTSGASETASARSKNCDRSLLQGDRSRWESDRSQIRPAGLLLRVRAHAYLLLYVSGRPEQLARQNAAHCGVKKQKCTAHVLKHNRTFAQCIFCQYICNIPGPYLSRLVTNEATDTRILMELTQ